MNYKGFNNYNLITYNNREKKSLLEQCYDNYQINNYIVVAKLYRPWNWLGKIKPVYDFLISKKAKRFDYVLATDANDILLINNPDDIIERFEYYQTDILFCNTVANWPPNSEYSRFELLKNIDNPFHAHLSAGGYFGKKEAVIKYLKIIIDAYENDESWLFHNNKFDDQLAWRALHFEYFPKLKVDRQSLIFKRFDNFRTL